MILSQVAAELIAAGVDIVGDAPGGFFCDYGGRKFRCIVLCKSARDKVREPDTGMNESTYKEIVSEQARSGVEALVLFADSKRGIYGDWLSELEKSVTFRYPAHSAWNNKDRVWMIYFRVSSLLPLAQLFSLTPSGLENMVYSSVVKRNEGESLKHVHKFGVYRPSELGFCIRKQFYTYTQGGEGFSPQVLTIFEIGNSVHAMIASLLGAKAKQQEVHVSLKIDNEVVLSGRADLVLGHNSHSYCIEIKSTSHDYTVPKFEHRMQLQIYLHALGFDVGYLLYVNKTTGNVKAFKMQRDERELAEIRSRALELHEAIKSGEPPRKEGAIDPYRARECYYCPFLKQCQPDLRKANNNY
jgi:CRISPR-associated exonuclease Cas4